MSLEAELCPQVTLGSQAPWRFINILYIHTSYYYRVNYGKEIPNTACCCVTCNCPSKLSIHTHLDEYVKALPWKTQYLTTSGPVPLLAWPSSPLRCSFCSLLNKLVLPWVRPQILLCVLTKNWSLWGRVLFDSPYLVTVSIFCFNWVGWPEI